MKSHKDMQAGHQPVTKNPSFLCRFRRDQKGTSLAIIAASLIPVMGAIGGGVDMTRAYMAEARLQQAVDAAALAGRKVLVDADVSGGAVAATTPTGLEIKKFIDVNFPAGTYDSSAVTVTRTFDAAQSELTVKASTSIPTSLLAIIGMKTIAINAESSSKRSGVNVDIVLALDVTGSMAWAIDGDADGSYARIKALRSSTLGFLDTIDDLRDQLSSSGLAVRVGIVPYSQTANVGIDLYEDNENNILKTNTKYYSKENLPYQCNSGNSYCSSGNASNNGKWSNGSNDTGNVTLDLTDFIDRGRLASSYTDPYNWKGCVEMRQTIQTINSSTSLASIPAGAWDIRDVEAGVDGAPPWQPYLELPNGNYSAPTSGTATGDDTFKLFSTSAHLTTRVPYKIASRSSPTKHSDTSPATSLLVTGKGPNHECNDRMKKMQEWTKDDLSPYINGLTVAGNTYHDIGMFWALALISPGKPFANPTTFIKSGYSGQPAEVRRYIVFMTDGEMDTSAPYSAFGDEGNPSSANNHTTTSSSARNAAHRRRFQMLCEEAKRTGTEISTVAFSTSIGSTDKAALSSCATSVDHYYEADSASDLDEAFLKIARNIGYLRVSK